MIGWMDKPSNADLERLLAQHDIPTRRLYPWWYRLYRRLGLNLEPPIWFSLREHFIYEGGAAALIALVAAAYNACCMATSMRPLIVVFAMIIIAPLWNWWDFRRLRNRIGL